MGQGWTAAALSKRLRENPGLRALDAGSQEEPLGPVVLVLPWPPTLNHRHVPTSNGRLVKAPAVRAYERQAELAIGVQHRGYAPLTGPLYVAWEFHQHDQRRRDLDNLMKGILDTCTRMKVFEDDSQIDGGSWHRIRHAEQS